MEGIFRDEHFKHTNVVSGEYFIFIQSYRTYLYIYIYIRTHGHELSAGDMHEHIGSNEQALV